MLEWSVRFFVSLQTDTCLASWQPETVLKACLLQQLKKITQEDELTY